MKRIYDDQFQQENDEGFGGYCGLISVCCGKPPLGEVFDDCGICSGCRDHATFEQEIEEE